SELLIARLQAGRAVGLGLAIVTRGQPGLALRLQRIEILARQPLRDLAVERREPGVERRQLVVPADLLLHPVAGLAAIEARSGRPRRLTRQHDRSHQRKTDCDAHNYPHRFRSRPQTTGVICRGASTNCCACSSPIKRRLLADWTLVSRRQARMIPAVWLVTRFSSALPRANPSPFPPPTRGRGLELASYSIS